MKIVLMFALMTGLGSMSSEKPRMVFYPATERKLKNTTDFMKRKRINDPYSEGSRRIFGGHEAPEGKFPFMVFAHLGAETCSGCLIKLDWVLLAARCIVKNLSPGPDTFVVGGKANLVPFKEDKFNRAGIGVRANESGLGIKERLVEEMYRHPDWKNNPPQHDVGLLKLEETMVASFITTIPLSSDKFTGIKHCTILGWGYLPPNLELPFKLMYADGLEAGTWTEICKSSFLCVKPTSRHGLFCYGDVGSPLLCDGKVWAVASHFHSDTEHCEDADIMFYAELHSKLEWIQSVTSTGKRATSLGGVLALLCCACLVSMIPKGLNLFILRI